MIGRRALWAASIAFAVLLFVFANSVGTLIILVVVTSVPTASALLFLPAARHVQILLALPDGCDVSDGIRGSLNIAYHWPLPTSCMHLTVTGANRLVSQNAELPLLLSLRKGMNSFPLNIKLECCGWITVAVCNAYLTDPFGIARAKLSEPQPSRVLALPRQTPIQLDISPEYSMLIDSDRYSMDRPGNDPSETFAIRAYNTGDPLKYVHWKLTAKTGSLAVRELGLPIINQVLLVLETAVAHNRPLPSPRKANAMVAALLSLSASLQRTGVLHTLCWRDAANGNLQMRSIEHCGDIDTARDELLDNPVTRNGGARHGARDDQRAPSLEPGHRGSLVWPSAR